MNNPISTYRLQFHKEFTFQDFEKIIPYLKKLGIGTIYASPIFHSVPGSTHGYDGLNPHQINPEIGNEIQLRALSRELKEEGIAWLQDIVPNHMAFHPDNQWLSDVLEKGRQSVYAPFFDILWDSPQVMAPFLGSSLDDAVKNGELSLCYKDGRLAVSYFESCYPLNFHAYLHILSQVEHQNEAIKKLVIQLKEMHQVEDPKQYSEQWHEFRLQLASLFHNQDIKKAIDTQLDAISNNPENLLALMADQHYRLCHWQETDSKINFRRFFTVNGLICLNMQDDQVFDHFHAYIKQLTDEGIFQGLRVDHIDGLYDPGKYLNKLRQLAGDTTYTVVEKILEPGEQLPKWPVQGNTGYDFLAIVNNLFTNAENQKEFTRFYEKLTGNSDSIHQQTHDKKAFILKNHMQGELENLCQLFLGLGLAEEVDTVNSSNLKDTLGEFLVHTPVYRYYGNQFPLNDTEQQDIANILKQIKKHRGDLIEEILLLENALLQKPLLGNYQYNANIQKFYQRLMQFTGPLMAKGVEDTLMYTCNRFIGHNEVGDSPEAFGLNTEEFHKIMSARQRDWPLSLNGTSTHDTKRGEDVRARLNVLSDLPNDWFEAVELWNYVNSPLKQNGSPEINDEYFIYQTLIGAYPFPGQGDDNFETRIEAYLEKALRETKENSDWAEPNEEYETAAKNFAVALLNKEKPFWKHFESLQKRIADFGIINSLAQVLLKFTCPGVPDVYQGCELWDLSLVDPDNRRPIDFEKRAEWLNELTSGKIAPDDLLKQLWESRYTGKVKLWLTHQLFNERKSEKEVFEKGQYIPLKIKGRFKENVLAFARLHKRTWYVTVAPLHLASLCKQQKTSYPNIKWKQTRVVLPKDMPEVAECIFSKTKSKISREILIDDIFGQLPIALLKLKQPTNSRSAGILLHITSLPSFFGVGDIGPEAKAFADFLYRSKQKYWQILPLSPAEAGQGYSPYSALSTMAGYTLLISPERLAEAGLLDKKDLKKYYLPQNAVAAFVEAEKNKDEIFDKAYSNFLSGGFEALQKEFNEFLQSEAYWLDNYALYIALKLHHEGLPWYQWKKEYRLRGRAELSTFEASQQYIINKTKWLQFIFKKQWNELKSYCNDLGIQIFGDLPFYVSYDSADVWANPEVFSLDEEGRRIGVAGVPPDYFNDNGQLWGMPVFKWDVLKAQGYQWWIARIRKNMELFDVLRLDHFRAFSSYWEVPATEETAKNGEWKPGPASDFFRALERELGKLPFIAEDLGDIDQPVYDLRDEFNLPGMKVLQFAFGDNMPQSVDIPHNYGSNFFAYTGTHDNNTSRGWYLQEADSKLKERFKDYTGVETKAKNINRALARLAYASVAKVAILPLQDVLGLSSDARMNTPASGDSNWTWRLSPAMLKNKHEKWLSKMVRVYNRL